LELKDDKKDLGEDLKVQSRKEERSISRTAKFFGKFR